MLSIPLQAAKIPCSDETIAEMIGLMDYNGVGADRLHRFGSSLITSWQSVAHAVKARFMLVASQHFYHCSAAMLVNSLHKPFMFVLVMFLRMV
jgi:hypothetical protein